MTPAELKTLRESLGLTLQWVADRARVNLRTAQYWESGRQCAPADVCSMLLELERAVEAQVAAACGLAKASAPQRVMLVRYRTDAELHQFRPEMAGLPASCHAALLARLQRAMWSMSIQCGIQFMDTQEYMSWLGGREDSETLRAEWAAGK